jgi:hypothetical protein
LKNQESDTEKLERWGEKLPNCVITPQANGPTPKSLTKWGEPKALSAIFYSIDKIKIIT